MKKHLIHLSILFCLLAGCHTNSETRATVACAPSPQVDGSTHHADSTEFIVQFISDALVKRKLEYKVIEAHTGNTHRYTFKITSLQHAELHLLLNTLSTAGEAIKELHRIAEEKEKEPAIKIHDFIFRKENTLYSIRSTENVSHIRSEIYDSLLTYFNVEQRDTILY